MSERASVAPSLDSPGWFGVEIRHFAALRAVASYGSFRRAAESLGFTQSAVSQQIATLERRVQVRLVERPRRGSTHVRLTPAGELLLGYGEEILSRMSRARAELSTLVSRATDALRLGTATDLGSRVVPDALARLRRGEPELFLSIVRAPDARTLTEQLAQGALDLAFYDAPPADADLDVRELAAESYVLLALSGSPAAQDPVTFSRWRTLPLIATEDSGFHHVERDLQRRGITLDVVARSTDFQTTLGLVAAGVGLALVPQSVSEDVSPVFDVLPTEPGFPLRRIWVAHHRRHQLSRSGQSFLALLQRSSSATQDEAR